MVPDTGIWILSLRDKRVKVEGHFIQQLAERLKAAVRETRNIETAQVQVVGLEDVKRRAGPLWPELSKRVRDAAAEFISRRIAADDIVIPAGDGFLVIYAETAGAEEKSRALQSALDTFYLGEEATRGVQVSVAHQTIDSEALIRRLSAPSLTVTQPAPAPAAPTLVLLPVWSMAQEAVTGYWIAPAIANQSAPRLGYSRVWTDTGLHREADDFLELDFQILERAVAEAQGCLRRERRCLVGYSVHATTMLNRPRRQAYLQALSAAPGDVRPYLLGRIAELEIGAPIARVAEWVHQLRAVSQRMAIQLHHSQKEVGGLQDVGIFSVAIVLPTTQKNAVDRIALERAIPLWSRVLKRDGLKLRLDNVTDPRLLFHAVEKGADFCSGETLWPMVAEAEGMRPYSRDRFAKALLPQMGLRQQIA